MNQYPPPPPSGWDPPSYGVPLPAPQRVGNWFARHHTTSIGGAVFLGLLAIGALTDDKKPAAKAKTSGIISTAVKNSAEGASLESPAPSPSPARIQSRPAPTATVTVTATATVIQTVAATVTTTVSASARVAPLLAAPVPKVTVTVTAPTEPAAAPVDATDPRFSTCKEAKAAGYGHYRQGEDAEYDWYRDADHDGVVCE